MKIQNYVAEFFGTFMLVFLGTATVVIAKGNVLAIGLAFGLAITISAYSFGAVSGGHFNPAVTTAMWLNKKIEGADAIGYIISQFIGALVASGFVKYFVSALGQDTTALGQTDFTKISSFTALIVECLATFLIIVCLNLTGGSLNPARSFGPALLAGGSAISHYWVYLLAPEIGAVLTAYCARFFDK